MLLRLLRRRFGESLPDDVPEQVEGADAERLEAWIEQALVAQSLAGVFASRAV